MCKNKIVVVVLLVVTIVATNTVHVVGCGTSGAFCGRGPSRVDCCDGYYCNIAPDDSYANCTLTCGTSGQFCGRGLNRKDCCPGYTCNISPDDRYAYCIPTKIPTRPSIQPVPTT